MLLRCSLALALTTAATASQAGPPGPSRSVYPPAYRPVVIPSPTLQPSYQPVYPAPAFAPPVVTTIGAPVVTSAPVVTPVAGTVVTSAPVVSPAAGYVTTSSPVVTSVGGVVTTSTPVVTTGVEHVSGYTPVVTSAATPVVTAGSPVVVSAPASLSAGGFAGDGLDEVNAKRAARGLRPFLRDEGLMQAARSCAQFRAGRGISGHTSNDFAFVPAGTHATSAGCAAAGGGFGWLSCCTYENYTYAGAAYVTGRDGKRYMHLFVR